MRDLERFRRTKPDISEETKAVQEDHILASVPKPPPVIPCIPKTIPFPVESLFFFLIDGIPSQVSRKKGYVSPLL